ncbi:hypothetical protein E3E12_02050 [Formicincola oecophyllae]|uniref:Uncharacterized protein n=1 Tax=Formicincola oecophyllae TaxID=2558361 RepID=A0A4Y6U9E6_9PROT|nr:hypothetical protein [Formicincola oecophyllae]QDH13178.1 hypothetical protein E3E12_02050 [Formicincola oecophyllae]
MTMPHLSSQIDGPSKVPGGPLLLLLAFLVPAVLQPAHAAGEIMPLQVPHLQTVLEAQQGHWMTFRLLDKSTPNKPPHERALLMCMAGSADPSLASTTLMLQFDHRHLEVRVANGNWALLPPLHGKDEGEEKAPTGTLTVQAGPYSQSWPAKVGDDHIVVAQPAANGAPALLKALSQAPVATIHITMQSESAQPLSESSSVPLNGAAQAMTAFRGCARHMGWGGF